jgi:hypothetical protein
VLFHLQTNKNIGHAKRSMSARQPFCYRKKVKGDCGQNRT